MKNVILAALLLLPVTTFASSELYCKIELKGKGSYQGPCTRTNKGRDGSFFVTHPDFAKKLKVNGIGVHAMANDYAMIESASDYGYGKVLGVAYATTDKDGKLTLKGDGIKFWIGSK
ncbi:hypothetical protein [Acinetobacter modestus]|uniref:DUF2845 domain-containing protein n=1 Tax=Acinetobacter modestus TaxID=1776740 RepID=A0ABP2U226_9GAMM|nr:hypothetical protein [Acinetobacter modestus]ENU28609.1 hypothetical protein F992_00025 [Acinetobacter modestus]GGA29931.1 hypothetical protein GCM10017554_29060 [Acinetobacter modestus]